MSQEDRNLSNLYQKFPVRIERGKGAYVWDTSGKEYIDCMGGYGVALVGHCNPRVVEAIKNQAEKLIVCHMSLYNDTREDFLTKTAAIAPQGLNKIFFSNSGAEAVEAALKFSRRYTGKPGIISMNGGYHGKTFGALSVTYSEKYRKPFMPLLEGVKFLPYTNPNIEDAIDDSIGTVIVEPIQGETGIILPPDRLLQNMREVCTKHNIILIFDEIQSGFGRTGKMWAGEHWKTVPDIMCLAKGIAGGVPIGLTLCKPEIVEAMRVGEHSSTFGGNPLACAAGSATIEALIEDKLVENAAALGNYFKEGLLILKDRHKIVREVRGIGMMLAVELRFDVKNVLLDGIRNGLLMLYSGKNILRLLPPLVMEKRTVSTALEIIDNLLLEEGKRRNV
ncbi:MAG: aspartate aminotransferase family protein [Nitrososphaeraceae archaeon]|jgi:LysW-gamma-L-lysine/LysW-L-ornithine aminotransferase|nr:aspartate aminotransferase family protein [Nitrososphaeraceae archaeon]MDW0332704.1 aspartate aminotransferase family protein [Nitrososphaeraceae archaeon]